MHFWYNPDFFLLALKIYVRRKTLRNKETAIAQNDNVPTEMLLAAYARFLIFAHIVAAKVAAWQQVVRASISI